MADNENNNSNNQKPNPFTNVDSAKPLTSDRFNNSFDPSKFKDKKKDNT